MSLSQADTLTLCTESDIVDKQCMKCRRPSPSDVFLMNRVVGKFLAMATIYGEFLI